MTTEKIHPDDPRLTAYVLDELDATQRAELEALISGDPDALAAVAELRETIGLVSAALSHEPVAAFSESQRSAIAAAAEGSSNGQVSGPSPAARERRFRGRYVVVATCVSIAAALVLAAVLPALLDRGPRPDAEYAATYRESPSADDLVQARQGHTSASGERWARTSGAMPGDWEDRLREPDEPQQSASERQPVPTGTPFGLIKDAPVPVSGPQAGAGGYGLPGQQGGQTSAPDALSDQPVDGWSYRVSNEFGSDTSGAAGPGRSVGVPSDSRARVLPAERREPEDSRLVGRDQAPAAAKSFRAPSAIPGERSGDLGEAPVSSDGLGIAAGGREASEPQSSGGHTKRSLAGRQVFEREAAQGVTATAPLSAAAAPATATAAEAGGLLQTPPAGFPAGGTVVGLPPATSSTPGLDVGFQQGSFNLGTEAYAPIIENEFTTPTGQAALSTFSIDVDTASYSNIRRFLTHGQFPPPDAVRIEELLNYFRYDYPQPEGGAPFSVTTEIGVCPWNADHRLARIGLKGREISRDQRPPSNLVFLIDVSGSMRDANKLPLVQQGLEMLVGEMTEDDRVAIVTYAGEAGVKLPSTSGDRRDDILSVIRGLSAGGSTNGEAGIHLAYTEAIRHHIADGTNRVILCSDGDFNVGVSDDNELVRLIQDKARQSRVFLSIFGFGMGNLKDAKLEQLANKGNGQYAYVDNPREARKVFVEEMAGSLYTIAKDVKIQVEFNPARVGAYRLIGYENRALAARDFQDDTKDAGEIGAGHTVTALYEIVPADKLPAPEGEPLKYQQKPVVPAANASPESLTLKLRYKLPKEDTSTLMEFPVVDDVSRGASPSRDFDWAASVAAFGLVLRNSAHKGQADLELVRELALGARGPDESGLRREFIDLVYTAKSLHGRQTGQPAPSPPQELSTEEAETRATVSGKYRKLLKRLHAPQDFQIYGGFNDYGYWAGTSYAGQSDLPQGHWVYVYPHWHIWGEATGNSTPATQPQ